MSPLPNDVELTPEAPGTLTGGRFRLDLPKGAVQGAITARLTEEAPAAALPPDFHLRAAFNLAVVAGKPPVPPDWSFREGPPGYRFQQHGTLTFSYDGIEDATLPDSTLQVRVLSRKSGLWTEVPATFDRRAKTVSATVWSEGVYALVANFGLVPLPPLKKVIGAAGGTLDFARLHLDFAPGCFAGDTEVTVGPPAAPVASWQGALPFPFEVTAKGLTDGKEINRLGAPCG